MFLTIVTLSSNPSAFDDIATLSAIDPVPPTEVLAKTRGSVLASSSCASVGSTEGGASPARAIKVSSWAAVLMPFCPNFLATNRLVPRTARKGRAMSSAIHLALLPTPPIPTPKPTHSPTVAPIFIALSATAGVATPNSLAANPGKAPRT